MLIKQSFCAEKKRFHVKIIPILPPLILHRPSCASLTWSLVTLIPHSQLLNDSRTRIFKRVRTGSQIAHLIAIAELSHSLGGLLSRPTIPTVMKLLVTAHGVRVSPPISLDDRQRLTDGTSQRYVLGQ